MTNKKSTKRALITSALAMLMCVAMLIGTTFAWFTDTASTAVNKIQSGTLDVELWQADADAKLGADALKWVKAEGHETDEVLWEPGCTYNLESFRIKNNGNLALKYKVIISGIIGDAKLLETIDFTVKVGNEEPTTLANWDGNLAADAVTDKITITGTMKTTAGNEYQDLTIDGISITVVATQDTVEYDSNSNQYDKDAAYPDEPTTATELTAALTDRTISSVKLAENITVEDGYDLNIKENDKSIDFNGKTLNGALSSGGVSTTDDPNVNLVLSDPNNDGSTYSIDSKIVFHDGGGMTQMAAVSVWKPTVTIESGRYTHDNMVILCQLQTQNADAVGVVVNGGTFDGGEAAAVIADVIGTVIVNGGTFNAKDSESDFGACVYLSAGTRSVPSITTINGGTFNAGKVLFYVDENSGYTQKINVTGGTFNVAEGGSLITVSSNGNAADYLVITGGTFNVDPSAYVDTNNYKVTKSGNTWTVTAK